MDPPPLPPLSQTRAFALSSKTCDESSLRLLERAKAAPPCFCRCVRELPSTNRRRLPNMLRHQSIPSAVRHCESRPPVQERDRFFFDNCRILLLAVVIRQHAWRTIPHHRRSPLRRLPPPQRCRCTELCYGVSRACFSILCRAAKMGRRPQNNVFEKKKGVQYHCCCCSTLTNATAGATSSKGGRSNVPDGDGLIVPHATNLLAMVPDALANTCTVYLQLAVSLGRQARWRAPVPASWPRHPRRVRHLSPPRVVDHLRARA